MKVLFNFKEHLPPLPSQLSKLAALSTNRRRLEQSKGYPLNHVYEMGYRAFGWQ